MPELQLQTRYSAVDVGDTNSALAYSAMVPSTALEPSKYCVYNQTRQRFLAASVEAADFSPTLLESRLAALNSGAGAGLLIVPFRGISPTSVRLPIDLVYLSQRDVVLATVESFPLSPLPTSCAPAASVLALPAHTIASAGTLPGDHLFLCPPQEVERRLQSLQSARAAEPSVVPFPSPSSTSTPRPHLVVTTPAPAPVIAAPAPPPVVAEAAPTPQSAPSPAAQPVPAKPKKGKASMNWLQRFFHEEPKDPRQSQREAFPSLVAYFFTGGTPVPHHVRDISRSGLYVYTAERWYLGTVIRITLTDSRQPAGQLSLTVNAQVVRWGNDGVGLNFILNDLKDRRAAAPPVDPFSTNVCTAHIEQFIHLLRTNPS